MAIKSDGVKEVGTMINNNEYECDDQLMYLLMIIISPFGGTGLTIHLVINHENFNMQ
jgi:hypothetical protein